MVLLHLFAFLGVFTITSAQRPRCPLVPVLPQIVGVLTTGGQNGHPAKITVNIRSRQTLQLEWFRSVSVQQAYNYTGLYRVPIKDDDSTFTIVKTKRGTSHHTSLAFSQSDTETTDFSLYHLRIDVIDECFDYKLTVTPPIGGANGAGIVMPRLVAVEKKTATAGSLAFHLVPDIPRQVMAAILLGGHGPKLIDLDITPWKRHFERSGRDLDWSGPTDVPEAILRVMRFGGYPTSPFVSTRPRSVSDPGLYMVTFSQAFMGLRLEMTVVSEVTDNIEGKPPSVGLATCGLYTWRNSTFGDVVPVRRGEPNCLECVASGAAQGRVTFAKQLILEDGARAGYRRLQVDGEQRMGDTYTSLRFKIDQPSEGDAGWYVCGATNQYGTTTRTYRVDVIQPVKLVRVEPSSVVLRGNGQTVSMKCTACGSSVNMTFARLTDMDAFTSHQGEAASNLRYRIFPLEPLEGGEGRPPLTAVTATRNGECVQAELEHRVLLRRFYRQGEKFACVAMNSFGDHRVGVADVLWEN